MAIGGEANNGSNNGKLYENTYYSRIRIKNADSKLSFGVSFRSGLLIFDISEQQEGFKYETLETIYLSPTKAKLLAIEIEKFKKYIEDGDIVTGKAFGVNAGMSEKVSYIGFSSDENLNIIITIGKIDGSGNILSSNSIMLNKEYHFALEWNNINAMDVTKNFVDNVELDQIHEICEDFSRYMNGVIGYSVADLTRYDNARILSKMDPIYDKLGIERKSSGNNGYNRGSNNFLNNAGKSNSSSNHISLDSIDDDLM